MNQPKLRFRKFSDEWQEKKLIDFAPLQRGFDLPNPKIVNGEYPVVFSNGILKTHNKYMSKAPGVVTGRSGTIGNVFFVTENFWPHNTSLWVTDFKHNDPKYVYYFYYNFKLEKLGTGSGVPTLNRNDIHSKRAVVPTNIAEQQKIAAFLTAVDEKISALKTKKELLDKYKKNLTQTIFSQKIRFKDSKGKEYPEWQEKQFSDLVTKVSDSYNTNRSSQSYKSIELESISQNTGELIQTFESTLLKSVKTKFQIGDVLYGKLRPYLRKFYLANFEGVCTSEIWVLRGKEVKSKFLYFLVQTKKFQDAVNVQSGSKMPRADWGIVSSTVFGLPCEEEQQKIAHFLTSIDNKIDLTKKELEQARKFKQALLQQMFV